METTREIRLFVASSIKELHNERMELGVFLDNLKTRYWKGLELVYEICENNSPAANPNGKQSEYDDWIRDCQLFYFLVGKRLGGASRHEFDLAWDCLCQRGSPRVLPFFKELAPEEREDSAKAFLDYYRNLGNGQYSYSFTHIDTVKLNIVLELQAGGWLDQPLTARDGEFRLGEAPLLLSTENIPVYRSHEALGALREQEAALEARLEADREGEDPEAGALRRLQTDAALEQTRKERRRIEAELLALCAAVTRTERDGSPATPRTLAAQRLVAAGDAEGALALLRAGDRAGEERSAEAIVALGLDRIRALLGDDKLRIRLLRTRPVSPETMAELGETYARAARLAERYELEPELLYDYVHFLWEEKDFRTAIPLGERLRARYERTEASPEDRAALDNLLGILYKESKDFSKAKERHEAALAQYRLLAAGLSEAQEANVAMSCNNLGNLLADFGAREAARKLYGEALEIRRRLAEAHPAAYEPDLAMSCNNLGNLLKDLGERAEARKLYGEALDIYRRLAEAHPAAYEPALAMSCNNLGNLLSDLGERAEARRLYGEALDIYRRLAEAHPAAYEPDLAMSCNNLGVLLKGLGERAEARKLYGEALEIRRRLAEAHPAAYEPDLATSCNNLGILLAELGERAEARKFCEEALDIYRRLAEAHPAAYEPALATSCNNLGILLSDLGERAEARKLYGEALDIYRRLAEAHPAAYEPDLAVSCNNLGNLLSDLGEREAARKFYGEALEIRRRLAEAHPAAYEPNLAVSCNNLGILLKDLGERAEARKLYGDALEIRRRLAEAHPAAYEPDLAETCYNFGLLEREEGHLPQARERFAQAEKLWRPYPHCRDWAERAARRLAEAEELSTRSTRHS